MSGERLRNRIATISDEQLADFCAYRWHVLTTGPGNICTPANHGVSWYSPWTSTYYPYRADIGSMYESPWTDLREQGPERVLHPNPFALSQHRQSHDFRRAWRIWDACVGIPACGNRQKARLMMSKVPIIRQTNTFWKETILPAYRHTGPLGLGGKVLRPTAPYTFDLQRMERGWDLLEAAHVLAHLRGDDKPTRRSTISYMGNTAGRLQQALTEIITCLAYDLPMNIRKRDNGRFGEPDLPYGTELKSSSEFLAPIMRWPWMNHEAPHFDYTLSGILTAVFIEPHPYGYNQVTTHGKHKDDAEALLAAERDRWACLPNIVTIVGWAGVDFITHQPLATIPTVDPSNPPPLNYAVRAEDMLPPDTYWYYLALAQRSGLFGEYKREDGWWYIWDWLDSEEYKALWRQTPPFPCKTCMTINQSAQGAPKRPRGAYPRGIPQKEMPEDWQRWFSDIKVIQRIQKKSVVSYEKKRYGSRQASQQRRARTVAGKLAREARDLPLREAAASERRQMGHELSVADDLLADAYEKRMLRGECE